jgi:hypothetical protein
MGGRELPSNTRYQVFLVSGRTILQLHDDTQKSFANSLHLIGPQSRDQKAKVLKLRIG